ncbi:hypothetical protein RvY_11035 [Ramazzottius varieornatus]|uniref:WH1 domain-containing protein n=1 Tax=Ramazzottius varieornatus TaxID=947166 RepID=A0A1D1VES6_RAMVA|nr:hypothetical protein RvY_11035 [Ramazzottius varieornatus]
MRGENGAVMSGSSGSVEQAIVVAHASVMVYDDVNKKWLPAGSSNGIAKVQIYQHLHNNTFRVVGRKTQDHEVVINCAIPKGLKYHAATPTFHQWRDQRQVYGLNFASAEDALVFASSMAQAVEMLNSSNPSMTSASTSISTPSNGTNTTGSSGSRYETTNLISSTSSRNGPTQMQPQSNTSTAYMQLQSAARPNGHHLLSGEDRLDDAYGGRTTGKFAQNDREEDHYGTQSGSQKEYNRQESWQSRERDSTVYTSSSNGHSSNGLSSASSSSNGRANAVSTTTVQPSSTTTAYNYTSQHRGSADSSHNGPSIASHLSHAASAPLIQEWRAPAAAAPPAAPPLPASSNNAGGPPPPSAVKAPPAPPPPPPLPLNGLNNGNSLANALQNASLRRTSLKDNVSTGSNGSTGSQNSHNGNNLISEMQATLARRKAKQGRNGLDEDTFETSVSPSKLASTTAGEKKTWGEANRNLSSTKLPLTNTTTTTTATTTTTQQQNGAGPESPKLPRKTLSFSNATEQDVVSRANSQVNAETSLDSAVTCSNKELERFKQEIMAEVRKELNQMKLDLIEVIRQELSGRR